MHKYQILLGTIGFYLILAVCFIFIGQVSAAEEEKKELKHVIIISIDGLNYEGYISTPVTNMKHLAGEGVIDEKATGLRVNTMEAAEASLLTGAFPEDHRHLIARDKVEVESLLEGMKKQKRTLMVVDGSGGKLQSFARGEKEYIKLDADCEDGKVIQQAIKSFKENKPFFTYIYLNDCKNALFSLDEKAYYESVKKCDDSLGYLINFLRKQELYYNSLIIVTSARSSSPSNFVPLIMHGPGCKIGSKITGSMVIDIAPTVCRVVGLDKLYGTRGIPIYEALDIAEDENLFVLNSCISELKKSRIYSWNKYFDTQDELYSAIRQIGSIKEERQSIFDFAGEREQVINRLKTRLNLERLIYLGIFIFMLSGYFIEYRILKKKFLLFR
ncbi:MAG: hypothetical protein PHT79_06580 [Syntrophomonadaceae bacterium]|nr:hypothetical protein [Syntrophomonadaceae bacterium]MDD3889045.1 hypothetical protein [Syntrophomonadaceae bacterium]MDD4549409.1 hypothetical protein [Syntrophomonadaceae bacterium]